jgi:hypothetical protein
MTSLNPVSQISAIALPATGTHANVSSLPFGIYESNGAFVSGAVDQVAYTYAKLGGAILDIEIKADNVYAVYEEAVLEYSYIVNTHQAKNVLSTVLGFSTGSFDQDGELVAGPVSASLKYPGFQFGYAERVSSQYSTEAVVGGDYTVYSASFSPTATVQDYNLQQILSNDTNPNYNSTLAAIIGNKKVKIKDVYYKTPASMWRFFGFYGNFTMVGNMNSYGQYSDDSIFYIVPVWQNKLQAQSYEDALHTRVSHYSYELLNNNLRLFPVPSISSPDKMWVRFIVPRDPWTPSDSAYDNKHEGINNYNTLPFTNIPYEHINSMGKQWIRRYALALAKEVLGQVRGKLRSIPIPNGEITLNADALLTQAKSEQDSLKEELKKTLDELAYTELAKRDAELVGATETVLKSTPAGILVG